MWSVIVCDGDETEREQLLEYIRRFSGEKIWEVTLTGCADWPELHEKLGQVEPDVIIIAQDGVEGLNTLTNIHLPSRKFIWFSDLDFGLQAYRLCVPWFGSKPVTYEKMVQALTRCIEIAAGTEGEMER
ncbi:MAG: hypothetical protein LIP16_03965 [Clostridium sp.]|nr:hypothetical protein [Clostridium sp.]